MPYYLRTRPQMASYGSTKKLAIIVISIIKQEQDSIEPHIDDDLRGEERPPKHTDKQPSQLLSSSSSSSIMGCGQSTPEPEVDESRQRPRNRNHGPVPVSSSSRRPHDIPYAGIHEMDVLRVPEVDPALQARLNDRGSNPRSNTRAHLRNTTQHYRNSPPGNHGGSQRTPRYGHAGNIPTAQQAQFGSVTAESSSRQAENQRGLKVKTNL